MIGFGELRRRASEWKQDISDVERLYATDWLLKGIFDQTELAGHFALRGASALRFAYAPTYSLDESPEVAVLAPIAPDSLRVALETAARSVQESGVKFTLADVTPSLAVWDYVGPLGRRSAAQPHIRLVMAPGHLQHPPVLIQLVHRFTDACDANIAAVALEELAAERIVALASPTVRARDIYDLWFILTELASRLDRNKIKALVGTLARAKNIAPLATLSLAPSARSALARSWDASLRRVPDPPFLEQVEKDLSAAWAVITRFRASDA